MKLCAQKLSSLLDSTTALVRGPFAGELPFLLGDAQSKGNERETGEEHGNQEKENLPTMTAPRHGKRPPGTLERTYSTRAMSEKGHGRAKNLVIANPFPRSEGRQVRARWGVRVYQGEDEDALKNVLVGNFTVEGLTETREPNEVLCRMSLDVDGILRVTAIEKRTGKSKQITIQDALREKSEEEIAAARKRLEELFSTVRAGGMELFEKSETPWEGTEEEFDPEESFDGEEGGAPVEEVEEDSGWSETIRESYRLVERSRSLFGKMHDEDKEEAIDLNAEVETAIAREDREALEKARRSLEELLFFVEGK